MAKWARNIIDSGDDVYYDSGDVVFYSSLIYVTDAQVIHM
jgi:hypothetical protein